MIHYARTVRGNDWPPELHAACDEVECAGDRLVNAQWGAELEPLGQALDAARRRFGKLLLELDKKRRPQIYAERSTPPHGERESRTS